MSYKPNDSYFKVFITSSPTTGAATDADSLPVATGNRNGTDDPAWVLSVAKVDAGRYKITGTIPGTYAAGDVLNVTVSATVGGVTGKALVDTLVMDSKRVGDLRDSAYNGGPVASVIGDVGGKVIGGGSSPLTGVGVGCNVVQWGGTSVGGMPNAGNVTVGGYTAGQDPGSYLTGQGYTAARALKLDNLDAAVSTRSTFAGGLVAGVTAPVTVGTNNDKAGYSLSGGVTVYGYASGQDPATLVLDAAASGHNQSNSIGARLNAPGGPGADPWATPLPGNYAAGTAGSILGGDFHATLSGIKSQTDKLPPVFPPNFASLAVDPATGGVTVVSNQDKQGYLLAPSGLDAVPVETGVNARQALSPILAAASGVVSGAGTGTIVIKGGNVTDTRIRATTDKAGNRSVVTLTLPPATLGGGTLMASSSYFPMAYFPTSYFPMGKTSQTIPA